MSIISNLKTENNSISFELINDIKNPVKIGLANSLRRTIISNIDTYCIDKNSVIFYDSYTDYTILNDHFLIDRLILIPIVSDLKDIDYEKIIISCKKENLEENIISVYVEDFVCKNSETDEIIDTNKIFKYPRILFSKLIHNGKVSFECRLFKSTSENSGAGFSPVSACSYEFKPNMKRIVENIADMDAESKKKYMIHEYQRFYERNEIGEPMVYNFYFESIGFYDCKTILNMGLQILIDKFRFLSDEFKNSESSIVNHETNVDDFYRFTILDVNETIGEPLQLYLSIDKNVYYAGYIIEHPLKKSLSLKIKLKENNNIENVLLIIDSTFELLIKILNFGLKDIE